MSELNACESLIDLFYIKERYWIYSYVKGKYFHNKSVDEYRKKTKDFRYYKIGNESIDVIDMIDMMNLSEINLLIVKNPQGEIIAGELFFDFSDDEPRIVKRFELNEAKRIKNEIEVLLGWNT